MSDYNCNNWFRYPHISGFWWRRIDNNITPCWVELRPNVDESQTPAYYAHYVELGDIIKQALFETDVSGISWQKIKPCTDDQNNKKTKITEL